MKARLTREESAERGRKRIGRESRKEQLKGKCDVK
jgi:hypothetical protein